MSIPAEINFEGLTEDEKVQAMKDIIDELTAEERDQLYAEMVKLYRFKQAAIKLGLMEE